MQAEAVAKRQVKQRRVADLVPYTRNARTHPEAQVDQIAASIREFGWTNPILVDGNDVIAGHGRLQAAVKLGMESVPCLEVTGLTADQKRAYIIADNRLAEVAGWDYGILAGELQEIRMGEADLAALGFTARELDELIGVAKEANPPTGFSEYGEDVDTEHRCPKCGYEWSGKRA